MVLKPFWIFNVFMHSQYNCNCIVYIVNVCVSKQQCFKFKFCVYSFEGEKLPKWTPALCEKETNVYDDEVVIQCTDGQFVHLWTNIQERRQVTSRAEKWEHTYRMLLLHKSSFFMFHRSSWNSRWTNTDKVTSVISVHKALHWAPYHVWF